jgi:hypothetical protein
MDYKVLKDYKDHKMGREIREIRDYKVQEEAHQQEFKEIRDYKEVVPQEVKDLKGIMDYKVHPEAVKEHKDYKVLLVQLEMDQEMGFLKSDG